MTPYTVELSVTVAARRSSELCAQTPHSQRISYLEACIPSQADGCPCPASHRRPYRSRQCRHRLRSQRLAPSRLALANSYGQARGHPVRGRAKETASQRASQPRNNGNPGALWSVSMPNGDLSDEEAGSPTECDHGPLVSSSASPEGLATRPTSHLIERSSSCKRDGWPRDADAP